MFHHMFFVLLLSYFCQWHLVGLSLQSEECARCLRTVNFSPPTSRMAYGCLVASHASSSSLVLYRQHYYGCLVASHTSSSSLVLYRQHWNLLSACRLSPLYHQLNPWCMWCKQGIMLYSMYHPPFPPRLSILIYIPDTWCTCLTNV